MMDSRTILDRPGAQQLIGKGDMLYLQGNDPVRVQCAFVDTPEVEKIASYISKQQGYPTASCCLNTWTKTPSPVQQPTWT